MDKLLWGLMIFSAIGLLLFGTPIDKEGKIDKEYQYELTALSK